MTATSPLSLKPCPCPKCGYEWSASLTPEDVCHHTSGGDEYIVICSRCRHDGELRARPEWAVEAWNAKASRASIEDEVRELRALLSEAGAWLEDNMCGGELRERIRAALSGEPAQPSGEVE